MQSLFFLSVRDQSELRTVCVCQSSDCAGSEGATKSNISTPNFPLHSFSQQPNLKKGIHPVVYILAVNLFLQGGFDHKI